MKNKNPGMVIIHPTGNQNSRQAINAFCSSGALVAFISSLCLPTLKKNYFLPSLVFSEISRRSYSYSGAICYSVAPVFEVLRVLATRFSLTWLLKHEVGILCLDKIYNIVDRRAAKFILGHAASVRLVYGYEDGADISFSIAKQHQMVCVYELPIGYWREHHRINQREIINQPLWGGTWVAVKDSAEKLAKKDRELALADLVIVPSEFVAKTLRACPVPIRNMRVIPYGFPVAIAPSEREWYCGKKPLRLLYVGGLSQRKGLSYLCDAVRSLGDRVVLTIVGLGAARDLIREALPNALFLGSLEHSAVIEQMRKHDVLLFPSLFEGFGMVITEAMSQGMVVISTDRTALPDIANEESAICIPPENAEAIKDAVESLLADPLKVKSIGYAALKTAAGYTWGDYQMRLSQEVNNFVRCRHA